MELNGRLNISRISNRYVTGYIEIEITDEISGVRYSTIKVQYDDFAQAITGFGNVPCVHTVRGLDLIGKKRENKSVTVVVPNSLLDNLKFITIENNVENLVILDNLRDFIKKEVEKDGWKLYNSNAEIINTRNWKKISGSDSTNIKVDLIRFSEPTANQTINR